MITCKFEVNDQQIHITKKPYIVNDSNNYLKLEFTFKTQDWRDINKYLLVHKCGKDYLFELESENNNCTYEFVVPGYCMQGNRLTFTVYGEDVEEEVRITVESKTIILKKSLWTPNSDTPPEETATDLVILLKGRVETLEEQIVTKSEVDHTHTVADVTDFYDSVEFEIKKGYRILHDSIRTYGE